jgi:hypothetical protein
MAFWVWAAFFSAWSQGSSRTPESAGRIRAASHKRREVGLFMIVRLIPFGDIISITGFPGKVITEKTEN